jgi:hypothetical protein
MIQFNLLPDIKLEYIKTQRTKHLVILGSGIISGFALLTLVLLFLVVVFQKQHLSDLNKEIKTHTTSLKETKDLDKILTIQNQLKSLPSLHAGKVVGSRLFGYISQITPTQATISNFSIDFSTNKISFAGSTDSLSTVNKFVDTLKFTTFKTTDNSKQGSAFSNVVLTSFSKSDTTSSYSIDSQFDPLIFNSAGDIALSTPHIISTRSETEKPTTELFQLNQEIKKQP